MKSDSMQTTPPSNGGQQAQSHPETRHSGERESLPHLVRQVAEDIPILLSKEIALAKAEFREAANQVKAGVGSLAGGSGLALAGVFFVLLSAVYALELVMAAWAAALIVGVSALIIGAVMMNVGKKKVQPKAFKPERTVESVRRDKEMTRRAVS